MKKLQLLLVLAFMAGHLPLARAADANAEQREREIRDRYETVLMRNPFQERAFNHVYEGYLKFEGIDAWVQKLATAIEGGNSLGALLLQGQIYDRQFKSREAIAAFEKAAEMGEKRGSFKVLLGSLYYKTGADDKAATLLAEALDDLADLDQRSSVCRMLGNLYLRQGKQSEAIAVWKRIAELNPQEIFSQLELAEIYEDNRLWDEAIAVYRKVAELSADDAYRKCRALRSIGQCLIQAEKFQEAIATFEEALAMVAPGNWLFEDIKLRLVGVYEDIGDLEGLTRYLLAKLETSPNDLDFRDLLAETYMRMAKFDLAEKEYQIMAERNPRSSSVREKLVALYSRTGKKDLLAATYEKLIELFPSDHDYLRRLGEAHLRDNEPEKAKETWQRLVAGNETPDRLATLAGWYEESEFPDEAMAAYEKALQTKKKREWVFRLASLKFQKGDETNAVNLWLSVLDPATSTAEEYTEVANILEAHQAPSEAGPLRQRAVEKAPESLEYRLAYARNLMTRDKFDEALAQFEVLAGQSENEYFMVQGETGRLDAYRELGVLEEKQKEWERELEDNPNSAPLLGKLARLYERAGQREKAIELHERRWALDPENVEFARSLAAVYRGAKQIEQAVELLNELVEKDKNRARVYYKDLLDIYLGLDLREEAIAAAEKMVSLAPSDPEARLELAQVYTMYRQPEKGLQEYRAVLRLEPNEPDYHRQYGEALSAEKRWGEAQEAFRKMLDTSRENSTRLAAVGSLARIYLQQEQLEPLLIEFNRRVRNTPKKLAAYEELAAIYKESGQIHKAVETLESGLQMVDDKEDALKGLIRTAYEAQDFPKVRTYFEQLVATSGKPTAFEFERLGSIYAQMGEIEKAKETWGKILELNPKDPKLANQYAEILKREGFTDEAVAAKARAVELDPFNYKQRYEYAQLLATAQQQVQALEELRKLLELGDREEKKKEESGEKKVERLARAQNRGPVTAYQFMYGLRNSGQYFGSGWQGRYKDFRPNVIMLMASLARQSIGEDNFVKELEEQVAKSKDNTDLRRDLVAVYQMYNRAEDALILAEELIKIAPDDVDLLQQLALYYSSQQQPEKAIPLLEHLAQTQPRFKAQAIQGLVPLYFQNKQEEKALELVDHVIKENPGDIQSIYSMGSLMMNQGKFEKARAVYELAGEIDPRYRQNALTSIANSYKREGKLAESLQAYKELLLTYDDRMGGYTPNRRQAKIYTPTLSKQRNVRYGGGALGNFPQNVMGYIDYAKSQALTEIKQAASAGAGDTNAWSEYEQVAFSFSRTASQTDRDRAWTAAKLLTAFYLTEQQWESAAKLLLNARENGMEDVEWFNLSIYMAELQEDFERMAALYSELEQKYPGRSREITVAKASTWIMAEKYDEAAKLIRQMNQERVPPGQITSLIQPLIAAGEKKLARELLEQHLESTSRNSQALAMLANLYSEENEFEKAIDLARESWQRQAHGRVNTSWMYNYSGYYGGQPAGPSGLLRQLHQYHVSAGKSEILLAEFKDRLEKQPGSVQAHENLAELYRYNNQREQALEVYKALAEKRPHLQQTRKTIATLYTEQGDFKTATQIYEQLLKDYPTFYQQLSWELRYLYQRIGKGKDLARIEESMAEKARDPNQIRQMADRFRQSGELDKAAEMYVKAIKMLPQDTFMKSQLAGIYVEQGKIDEAIELYREHLDSPLRRAQGGVDSYNMQRIAGLFNAAGKLQELKDRCETELKKNPNDLNSQCLQAHIAILEKRFPEALAYYEESVKSGRDPNALYQLMQLAEITGEVSRILEIVDKNPNHQQYWDLQRVAKFFQAQGNEENARIYMRKWAEQRIQSGGGGWEFSEVLRGLTEAKFWDLAEEFAAKHRRAAMDDYYRQDFDRALIRGYVTFGRFTNVVDGILAKNNLAGRDLELVRELTRHYQQSNEPVKRRAVLEKVIANDPNNREIAFELAQLYTGEKEHEKTISILQRLVSEDPNNQAYRERYTDALIDAGRGAEALQLLQIWAEEKPLDQRYSFLSRTLQKLGRLADARGALVKAQEIADPTKKLDYTVQLARFDAGQGNIEAEKEALAEKFKTRKDANAFSEYLRHLKDSGRDQEAYDFFIAEKDGYLDRYRGNEFLDLCFNQGDLKTPLELGWQFLRYSESYNRDHYFRPVSEFFKNKGKAGTLLSDFKTRVESEPQVNKQLLLKLGQLYQENGFDASAAQVYTLILDENPYDQDAPVVLAALLEKLDRGEEAIELLRDRKPPLDLQNEITQKVHLIRACFKNKREAEAEKEIEMLLQWAKGGETLQQLAGIYFEQKNYEKAAQLFEQSDRLHRGYNRDQMLSSLAKCYAKLKQPDKATALVDELITSENSWHLDNLAKWCLEETEFETAIQLYEARLNKTPGDINTWFNLAQAHRKSGQPAAVFETLKRGISAMPSGSTNMFSRRAGSFLANARMVESALDQASQNQQAWMADMVLYAFAQGTSDKDRTRALAERMAPINTGNVEANLAAAQAFTAVDMKEPALRLLGECLTSGTSEEHKFNAIKLLAKLGAVDLARDFIAEQVEAKPQEILAQDEVFEAVIKMSDGTLTSRLLKAANQLAISEAQKKYYPMWIDYFSNRKEAALATAVELSLLPGLTAAQLERINTILKDENKQAERIQLLERIAEGGYGFGQKYQALADLTGLYASRGDLKKAIAAYIDLFPEWTMNKAVKALHDLASAVTEDNLPLFRQAVIEAVAAEPVRDANSQLIGIYAEIATRLKKPESISLLCAAAKLEGLEKQEAEAWATLIQDWEVTAAYSFESQSDIFDPETDYLKNQTGTTPWKKLNSDEVLGIVFMQRATGIKDEELNNKVAYARTTLESLEEKTVTVSVGSDDWIRVWVNGEEAHSSLGNRSIALDQDRFNVTLKKGKNTVLVKSGNTSNAWSFCMRLVPEAEAPVVTAAR